jgi:mannosyltransferase
LIAIIGLAFALRVITLDHQSLWRDEVDTIEFSAEPLLELLTKLNAVGHNGPLYFLLLYPWQLATGATEFAIRFPSAVAGTIAIPLGYILARQLGYRRFGGILLALLLATSPYLAWYGQEAKMYTIILVVITLAVIAYLRALLTGKSHWWVLFVAATTLSFYFHILSPLMLPVYVAIGFVYMALLRLRWRAWLISMACLTLPYIPLVWWQLPLLLEGQNSGHPFYPLQQQMYLLLQLYSGGLIRSYGITSIILFTFLLLVGFFFQSNRTQTDAITLKTRLVLALWIFLPTLAIYLISLRVPVFEDRYVIYITPPIYLVIVSALLLLRRHSKSVAALCLALVLAINLTGIWQQQSRPIKADFRAAAQHLANQPVRPTTIALQIPYLVKTFDYYYPYEYTFIEGLWTNDGKEPEEVHTQMQRLTAEVADLWLVVSEESMWDNRQLMRSWLSDHATLVNQAHFMRVDVYHYKLRPGTIDTQTVPEPE